MRKIALYPGSFDPVTKGHLDIVERSLQLFDQLIIAVIDAPEKKPLFSTGERVEMLENATGHLDNLKIDRFSGLLVNYAKQQKVNAIVRGLRAVSDFESEFQMALMNKRLAEGIETVFMMTNEIYSYLSSSIVKEIALLGGSVEGLVSKYVEEKLKERFRK